VSAAADPGRGARLRGHLCLGTACFVLGLAVLLPTQVYPRLAVTPADPGISQVQLATGGTALLPDLSSPLGVRRVHDVDVKITTTVIAAPGGSSDPDSVRWQLGTRITVGKHLLTARLETVSLDRRTARPTNCCGDRLVTDPAQPQGVPLRHEGYVTFPFDLQKRPYPVWDVQLKRARTAAFIGEEHREGLKTYVFRADTPFTVVGTQSLPGRLFGVSTPSVTATSEYSDQRVFWVEPATGSVVDLREVLEQRFRYQGRTVTALAATLDSPSLRPDVLEDTRKGALMLPWLRERASYVLAPIGLLLLAFWIRGRRSPAPENLVPPPDPQAAARPPTPARVETAAGAGPTEN
jgi:hypothetical protein